MLDANTRLLNLGLLLTVVGVILVATSARNDSSLHDESGLAGYGETDNQVLVFVSGCVLLLCLTADPDFSGSADPLMFVFATGMGFFFFPRGTYYFARYAYDLHKTGVAAFLRAAIGAGMSVGGAALCVYRMAFHCDPMWTPDLTPTLRTAFMCTTLCASGLVVVLLSEDIRFVPMVVEAMMTSLLMAYAIAFGAHSSLRLVAAFVAPYYLCSTLSVGVSALDNGDLYGGVGLLLVVIGLCGSLAMMYVNTVTDSFPRVTSPRTDKYDSNSHADANNNINKPWQPSPQSLPPEPEPQPQHHGDAAHLLPGMQHSEANGLVGGPHAVAGHGAGADSVSRHSKEEGEGWVRKQRPSKRKLKAGGGSYRVAPEETV